MECFWDVYFHALAQHVKHLPFELGLFIYLFGGVYLCVSLILSLSL